MPTRTGTAQWSGSITEGRGTVNVAGRDLPYSFSSRFEEGEGTNPEALLGAAHAGCFAMALSAALERAGFPVVQMDVQAAVRLRKGDDGFAIDRIALTARGQVDDIDDDQFQEFAENAKAGCPLSKALAAVPEITLDAILVS